MNFEDKYFDVLQNIEKMIVDVFHENPSLLDYDVERALDALISYYRAKQIDRIPQQVRLKNVEQKVYDNVLSVCNWRLGITTQGFEVIAEEDFQKNLDEIIACLKRIKKSMQQWNKHGGRQGYLNFVEQFIL